MAADASAAIGDLLLKGWAMTADSCHTCRVPLMKSPLDHSLLCVSCHEAQADFPVIPPDTQWEDISAQTDVRLGPYAAPPAHLHENVDMVEEDGLTSESVSTALAQKMLQGFTLLSQNCSQCHTPLVRKGQGSQMECVSCHTLFQSSAFSPNKRSSSCAASPRQPSTKAMRQHMEQHSVKSQPESSDMEWMIVTEQSLTSTLSSLAPELVMQASTAERHEIVSLMNACLDTLLKLKEFRKA